MFKSLTFYSIWPSSGWEHNSHPSRAPYKEIYNLQVWSRYMACRSQCIAPPSPPWGYVGIDRWGRFAKYLFPGNGEFVCFSSVYYIKIFWKVPQGWMWGIPRVLCGMANRLCHRGWGLGVFNWARADLQIPTYIPEVRQYIDSVLNNLPRNFAHLKFHSVACSSHRLKCLCPVHCRVKVIHSAESRNWRETSKWTNRKSTNTRVFSFIIQTVMSW